MNGSVAREVVRLQDLTPTVLSNAFQHPGNHRRIIHIADNRHEVWNHIKRIDEIQNRRHDGDELVNRKAGIGSAYGRFQ